MAGGRASERPYVVGAPTGSPNGTSGTDVDSCVLPSSNRSMAGLDVSKSNRRQIQSRFARSALQKPRRIGVQARALS